MLRVAFPTYIYRCRAGRRNIRTHSQTNTDMWNIHRPAGSWRPIIAGGACGLVVGASPFFYELPFIDQLHFGLGLLLTYTSIGALVTLLPRVGPRWLYGTAIGAIYSLPGSIFVAVPYPLVKDAPEYYRNFAAGGMEEFVMTFVYGLVVGLVCGLAMPRERG